MLKNPAYSRERKLHVHSRLAMYVHIGTCMYPCMHVGMCAFVSEHLCYMYACMYVDMYVCKHACMFVCQYACMDVCMYTYVCTCICVALYVCMCVCVYVYMCLGALLCLHSVESNCQSVCYGVYGTSVHRLSACSRPAARPATSRAVELGSLQPLSTPCFTGT